MTKSNLTREQINDIDCERYRQSLTVSPFQGWLEPEEVEKKVAEYRSKLNSGSGTHAIRQMQDVFMNRRLGLVP